VSEECERRCEFEGSCVYKKAVRYVHEIQYYYCTKPPFEKDCEFEKWLDGDNNVK